MKTDDLIRALSQDAPAGPSPARLALWGLLPAAGLALAGVLTVLGPRPDLAAALLQAPVLRHVLTAALFGLALTAALTLARPEGRARLWPLALVGAVALALLAWAWAATPPEARGMAITGKTQWTCLISIPVLSALPVAALMAALRRGASASPALSGALAGLAGGGLGACIYAVHCTENSPLFWVTWYGMAILGVTLVSALIGTRLLRW